MDFSAADRAALHGKLDELLNEANAGTARSMRVSAWDTVLKNGDSEPEVVRSYGVKIESGPLEPGRAATLGAADVDAILTSYPAPKPAPKTGGILLGVIADCQAGKIDGGGTEHLVRAWHRSIDGLAQRIRDTSAGRVGLLVLADAGDPIEGYVAQGGRNVLLDLSLTEQIRTMRRLWLHAVGVLAPLADRMLCPVVPDNHGQTTRQFNARPSDNFALEIAASVADALAMNDAYRHVRFVFPEADEISLAVNVGGKKKPLIVGFTHGHMTSSPNAIVRWWEGQALGAQPVAGAHILVTGHYHHLRVEQVGDGRTWMQAPALESGSDWFRHKAGHNTPAGLLSTWLHPGQSVPWSDLRIHG